MTNPQNEPPSNGPANNFGRKLNELKNNIAKKFSDWREGKGRAETCTYFKSNKWDLAIAGLLILGIIVSLFKGFIGGILIGIVIGVCFYKELSSLLATLCDDRTNFFSPRHLIIAGIALGLFIAAPGIIIGAIVTMAILHLFGCNEV
jgi:hypothetical protein